MIRALTSLPSVAWAVFRGCVRAAAAVRPPVHLWRKIIVCVVTAACVRAPALGVTPDQRFAEAQAAFDAARNDMQPAGADSVETRRRFRDAAERFAAIYRDGVRSANLCVNTGNAYHFSGDHPRALLWYLRALRLANTPETRNGVASLRRICGAELWPPPQGSIGRALMSWHYDVSRRTKQRILLATYPLGCLLLAVSVFVRRRSAFARVGLVLIVAGACMGISDLATAAGPTEQWAVVLESDKGYAGDGETYTTVVAAIRPGQEVRILERRPGWLRIALPGGITCWVRSRICEEA